MWKRRILPKYENIEARELDFFESKLSADLSMFELISLPKCEVWVVHKGLVDEDAYLSGIDHPVINNFPWNDTIFEVILNSVAFPLEIFQGALLRQVFGNERLYAAAKGNPEYEERLRYATKFYPVHLELDLFRMWVIDDYAKDELAVQLKHYLCDVVPKEIDFYGKNPERLVRTRLFSVCDGKYLPTS